MGAVEGDDTDVFGYHFENQMLAVKVFHLRGGKIVDRREFFWEELPELLFPDSSALAQAGPHPPSAAHEGPSTGEGACAPSSSSSFNPDEFFSALLKQIYIDQQYVPRNILVPVDFEDRPPLEDLLTEKRGRKVEPRPPHRAEN